MKERNGKRLRFRKWLRIAIAALPLLIAFGAWRVWVNAMPEFEIPMRELPRQNAFDVYVAAGKVLTRHSDIAFASGGIMPLNPREGVISDETRPCTSADRQAILRANATALVLLDQAASLKYREPALRGFSAQFPYYSTFRSLAQLMKVRGQEYEYRKDWSRATNDYLAIIRFGAAVSNDAINLTSWQIGTACEFIGRDRLWQTAQHLDASQLQNALQQLQKRDDRRAPFSRVLQEESWSGQQTLFEVFERRDWLFGIAFQMDSDIASTDWKKAARLQTTGKRGFFRDYVHGMNAAIADARSPYSKRQLPAKESDISYGWQPNFERQYFVDARNKTAHALLTTRIALRLYQLDHQTYPQNLQQLAPKYLQKIPADPCGGGEDLRYKRAGREYSLYSIGPDGIDNRGRAIEDTKVPKTQKRKRFLVQPKSKGDVVASVNYP